MYSATAQTANGFAALLDKGNVTSPLFMDTKQYVTSSLMYAGTDLLPAHYLTIWEAMLNCTMPYLQPHEWQIKLD